MEENSTKIGEVKSAPVNVRIRVRTIKPAKSSLAVLPPLPPLLKPNIVMDKVESIPKDQDRSTSPAMQASEEKTRADFMRTLQKKRSRLTIECAQIAEVHQERAAEPKQSRLKIYSTKLEALKSVYDMKVTATPQGTKLKVLPRVSTTPSLKARTLNGLKLF